AADLEPPQVVAYVPTIADYLAANKLAHQLHAPTQAALRWQRYKILTWGAGLCVLGFGAMATKAPPLLVIGGIALVIGLVMLLGGALRPYYREGQRLDDLAGELYEAGFGEAQGEVRFRLLKDRLRYESQDGNQEWYWSSVQQVHENEDMVLIYATRSDAAFIPARAFVGAGTFLGWCNLMRRLSDPGGEGEPTTAESTTESD
ncbi:MAG: YcxB family protein, partial [Planctomycetota bacterium]